MKSCAALSFLILAAGSVGSFVGRGEAAPPVPSGGSQLKLWCEPVDGNTLWNNGQRVFHTIQDSPTSLTFAFQDYRDARLSDEARLVVEVADPVRIAEAVGVLYLRSGNFSSEILTPQVETVAREGQPFRRYTWRALKQFLEQPHLAYGKFGAYVTLCFEVDSASSNTDHPVFYRLEDQGPAGAEKQLLLRCLPPLARTPNPTRFRAALFSKVLDINWHAPELLAKVLHRYEEANLAGRDPCPTNDSPHAASVDSVMRARGWQLSGALFLNPLGVPPSWMPSIGLKRAVNVNGQPFGPDQRTASGAAMDKLLCPTYVRQDTDFQGAYRNLVTANLARVRDGEPVWIDIEPFKTPDAACFCPECLRGFAQHAGIRSEDLTDPRAVLTKYRQEWIRYQTFLDTECIGLNARLIRELLPHSPVGIYNYALPYDNPAEVEAFFAGCRLDPRLLDQHVDRHGLSFYNLNRKPAMDMMDLNVRTLKREVWMYPSIARWIGTESFYTDQAATLSPDEFRTKLLAAAAGGAKGMVIYPGEYIDGMFFKTIDQAMAEIAAVERFYFDGQRCDEAITITASNVKSWQQHVGLRAHRLGEEVLLTLINFHPEQEAQLQLAYHGRQRAFTVYDPISQTVVADRGKVRWPKDRFNKGFVYSVPAMDAKLLVLRPYHRRDSKLKRVDLRLPSSPLSDAPDALRKQLDLKIARLRDQLQRRDWQPVALHNSTIKQEGPDVVMEAPWQKLWISPRNGGRIVKWQSKQDGTFVCPNSQPGAHGPKAEDLCWDLFWWPKAWRWKNGGNAEYQVVSASLADEGTAMLTLGLLRPEEAIYLEKTYLISEASPAVTVKLRMINLAEGPQTISVWSHHCPKLGLDESAAQRLAFQLPTPQGLAACTGAEGEFVYTAPGVTPEQSGFAQEKIKGVITRGRVVAQATESSRRWEADIEFDKLLQFYLYVEKDFATVEWMYKPVTLAPLEEWETRFTMTYQPQADGK